MRYEVEAMIRAETGVRTLPTPCRPMKEHGDAKVRFCRFDPKSMQTRHETEIAILSETLQRGCPTKGVCSDC
jgi:hypothetical protein